MKKFIAVLAFVSLSLSSFADVNARAVRSSVEGGRYEIVQSEITRKHTFLIDKKSGWTAQLQVDSEGNKTWVGMRCLEAYDPGDSERNENHDINYQIFMSGTAAEDCFLLNIHTGKIWQLFRDPEWKDLYWAPIYKN